MTRSVADFTSERLVRRAPNQILPLDSEDRVYVHRSLLAIEAAYGVAAVPSMPVELMPGRTLMRLLVDLRRRLKPVTADQRQAWGKLAGAILIVDNACAFVAEALEAKTRPNP